MKWSDWERSSVISHRCVTYSSNFQVKKAGCASECLNIFAAGCRINLRT